MILTIISVEQIKNALQMGKSLLKSASEKMAQHSKRTYGAVTVFAVVATFAMPNTSLAALTEGSANSQTLQFSNASAAKIEQAKKDALAQRTNIQKSPSLLAAEKKQAEKDKLKSKIEMSIGTFEKEQARRQTVVVKTPATKKQATPSAPRQTVPTVGGRVFTLTVTAYNSEVGQTDSSPWTTASGSRVHDGTLAFNGLPFGTKVKIPQYFGDKIFTVEDRTARRFSNRADIWMLRKIDALQWGIKRNVQVVVVK